ncbi:hypothetical protein ACGILS_25185 [Streptomyces albidoflavus]|uniref:hypothetical protein n=1 Tax=Streptomyces TaxID=1883 RepID=UPI0002493F18|nr:MULTISPECIES: hypothetical protein [Streptomyces]MCU7707024.1 hypothetical protein [Streptomyces albidoflavus]RZD78012.1 hypothetical protein C0Q61_14995 [Streptomyces albidoflavus]
MIVSAPATPSRLLPPPSTDSSGPDRTWRCLARRGMLHSECESFEQLRLAPGATWTHEPAHGTEAALYAVAGSASVHALTGTGPDARAQPLDAGGALLVGSRAGVRVTAGAEGVDLLAVRVLPADVTARLPARVPELPERQQTPIFRPPGDGH